MTSDNISFTFSDGEIKACDGEEYDFWSQDKLFNATTSDYELNSDDQALIRSLLAIIGTSDYESIRADISTLFECFEISIKCSDQKEYKFRVFMDDDVSTNNCICNGFPLPYRYLYSIYSV